MKSRLLSIAGLLVLSVSVPARARTVRTLISIGSSWGDPEDPPLRYATADAERFRSVFVEIGKVSPDRAYLLLDQPLHVIRERLAEVAGRLAEVRAAGDDAVLIIYASGHAKGGQLHVGGSHLPLSELRKFAERAPARLRLLIVDACESGLVARFKGGVPVPEFDVDLTHPPLSGEVVISSSGPSEPAQEWDALGGSLFTHHLLTGLRGDADSEHDGKVTLSEAYAYAYRRTVADAWVRSQHPALDVDLTGAGELVLTEPSTAKGALFFPPPLEGKFIVVSQPRADVVAEIDKRAGEPIRLAVPPGHYLVRKNSGGIVAMATIDMPYGGDATVDESKMSKWPYTEARMKGGYVELRPSALVLGGSWNSEQLVGTGARWSGELTFREGWGDWWAGARIGLSPSTFRGETLTTHEWDTSVALVGGYRWVNVPFSFYGGVSVGATLVSQGFVRDREQEILLAGGSPLPESWSLGASGGPMFAVEVPISPQLFTVLEADGLVRYLPAPNQSSWSVGGSARMGVGGRF